jgi:hypothetical protein
MQFKLLFKNSIIYSRTRVRLGEYNATSDVDCNEDMQCADPVQDIEIASIISHPRCKSKFIKNVN